MFSYRVGLLWPPPRRLCFRLCPFGGWWVCQQDYTKTTVGISIKLGQRRFGFLDKGTDPKKFNTVWYWIRLYDIKGDRWALEECPSLKEEPFHARKTCVSGGKWNQCIANKLNPLLSGIMMKWLIFHLSGRIMTSSCEYQLVNLIVFLWLLGCGQTTRNASIRSTSLLFRRVPSCGVMEHNKHEIPRGL